MGLASLFLPESWPRGGSDAKTEFLRRDRHSGRGTGLGSSLQYSPCEK